MFILMCISKVHWFQEDVFSSFLNLTKMFKLSVGGMSFNHHHWLGTAFLSQWHCSAKTPDSRYGALQDLLVCIGLVYKLKSSFIWDIRLSLAGHETVKSGLEKLWKMQCQWCGMSPWSDSWRKLHLPRLCKLAIAFILNLSQYNLSLKLSEL